MDGRDGRFHDFSKGEEKLEKRLWLLKTVTENTTSLTWFENILENIEFAFFGLSLFSLNNRYYRAFYNHDVHIVF